LEETTYIEEKIDTKRSSNEIMKNEKSKKYINNELVNDSKMINEILLTDNNDINNGVSIFEDNYDEEFYNDYVEDNVKLNDSVLNIDEYIDKDTLKSNNLKREAVLEDKNIGEINNKNKDVINNSNTNMNESNDSLSINNYNIDD